MLVFDSHEYWQNMGVIGLTDCIEKCEYDVKICTSLKNGTILLSSTFEFVQKEHQLFIQHRTWSSFGISESLDNFSGQGCLSVYFRYIFINAIHQ